MTDRTFAEALFKARQQRGLTQAELGKRAGIQEAAISHFEAGRRLPSYKNLYAISGALNVQSDILLGLDPPARCRFRDERLLSAKEREFVQIVIDTIVARKANPPESSNAN